VIDICTPNDSHAEIALECIKNGKMIMCEKPLALNGVQGEAMVAAVEASGLPIFVLYNYRFLPAVTLAKNIVAAGELGKVFHYRANFLQDWTISADLPQGGTGLWRLDAAVAGSGVTGDLLAHCIDTARWINGDIVAVSAEGAWIDGDGHGDLPGITRDAPRGLHHVASEHVKLVEAKSVGGADDRHRLARLDLEGQVLDERVRRVVGERDVVEHDPALGRLGVGRQRRLVGLLRGVEELEDPLGRRDARLQDVEH
jgi:predicted dehydrogenase